MLSTIVEFANKLSAIRNKKTMVAAASVCLAIPGLYLGGRISAIAPVVGSLENETMSIPAGGSIVNDPLASSGQALKLTQNNSYAQTSINLTGAAVNLVLTARGDYCKGDWPRVSLYVDGTNIFNGNITTSGWGDYPISISKAAGSHTVRATIRNYTTDTGCTRAVYLDRKVFYGQDVAPPPPADYVADTLATWPASPTAGQSVSFSAVARNVSGNNAQDSSSTSLRLDVGNDGTYDVNLPNQPTAALPAGTAEAESWADAWTATSGAHRFEVCADAGATLPETDELNNCSTQTFIVNAPPPPDYVTESLASAPIDPLAGQSISFLSLIRNQGIGNGDLTSATSLRLDIGDDGIYDVAFADQFTPTIVSNVSEPINWAGTWTAVTGNHRFEICADATNSVVESNEANNCSTQTFAVSTPLPNYLIENLLATPASLETGQSASFSAIARNISTGDATAASEASLRLDIGDDGIYDVVFASQLTGALPAAATEAENWGDVWTAVAGTHRFEICSDATNTVSESDEIDNCASATFTVNDPPPPPVPDYISEALASSPLIPITGEITSLLGMTRNQGTGAGSSTSEASLRIDVGNDGTYDLAFTNLPISDLAVSASEAANWTDVWTATVGTHRFEVCSDVANTVVEADETNNCLTQAFTVNDPPPPPPPVDYLSESITVSPAEITTGQDVSFSATVRNQSVDGAQGGSVTSLRLDVSDNGTYDVFLADQSTSALASGGTEAENWPDAWTAAAGTHRFEVCADASTVLEETDELNNCSTGTFVVSELPPGGCTIADTSGCVPGTVISLTDSLWACSQPLSNYGTLPIKVILNFTTVYGDNGIDLKTGCAGDSDPNSIDLILDVKGNGLTYGPGQDAVKVRTQAGYNNGIQITGRGDCGPRYPTTAHQDGVQAQGGRDITFVDFYIGDYDAGTTTCQGAGGAFFFSDAGGGYYGQNIHVIRGKYIACNKGLLIGSAGNSGSVTNAYFRSGRVDGTDPVCAGYNGPITCSGTSAVVVTNVSCQRWNSMQQTFVQLLWP